MGDKTGIEWADATWNPVTGCAKVSAGCKHCYAERDWARLSANPKTVYFGRKFTDVMCHPERLDQPARWQRPRVIFVNSMSDMFHPDVPFEFISDVYRVMGEAAHHTYLVLTKRPDRLEEWLGFQPLFGRGLPKLPGHIWTGVTVENQDSAYARIPVLSKMQQTVNWISAEPLLEAIDIELYLAAGMVQWVVAGGESGAHARSTPPHAFLSLRDQCARHRVPFFFKQWGRFGPPGRDLDGRTHDEWPGGRRPCQ
jgi:protein gp37